jgi:hypothetical protein
MDSWDMVLWEMEYTSQSVTHKLHISANIVMVIKSWWIEHEAQIVEICNTYRIFVKKYLGYWPSERPRWQDNIKMDQDYVQQWDLIIAVVTILVLLLGTR